MKKLLKNEKVAEGCIIGLAGPCSTLNMDRRTDKQAYLPIEMHFFFSVMFLGLRDGDTHEDKTERRTDGRTDRPSDSDARTKCCLSK